MTPEEMQFWLYMNQQNQVSSSSEQMQEWLRQQQDQRDQMMYMQQHNQTLAQYDQMINAHLLHLQQTNPKLYHERVELMNRLERLKNEAALAELNRDRKTHKGEIINDDDDDEPDDIIDEIFG